MTNGGNIGFANDVYLFGTTGFQDLEAGAGIITLARDLHVAVPGKTITVGSPLRVRNFILYAGTLDFGDVLTREGITASRDLA